MYIIINKNEPFTFSPLYFNNKNNAVTMTKKLYNETVIEEYGDKNAFDEAEGEPGYYNKIMKEIETGNFYDDFILIEEIETED